MRSSSVRGSSLKLSVISAGIIALVTLSSCAQGASAVPDKTSPAAQSTSVVPNAADGRPAAAIFNDFMGTAAAAVEATDTVGWTYADGSSWNPDAPDIVFNPKPCRETADGAEQRTMQFGLLGPAPADPRAARDQMQAYLEGLEDQGYKLSRSMDPPAGNEPKNTYVVGARRADGAYIDYGANDAGQRLNFGSECSAHSSLQDEVSAQTD